MFVHRKNNDVSFIIVGVTYKQTSYNRMIMVGYILSELILYRS